MSNWSSVIICCSNIDDLAWLDCDDGRGRAELIQGLYGEHVNDTRQTWLPTRIGGVQDGTR